MAKYDALQTEFCPPLDTSLLAALIADLPASPRREQVDALRATLKELASQATTQHEHDLAEAATTDDSGSCPYDACADTTASSATSESSAISRQSFSSPLGFLQAALPHIHPSRLRRALGQTGSSSEGDVDMESVVETLLTDEYIRELEERGLDDGPSSTDADPPWRFVESKRKMSSRKPAKNKKTIALVDVRQRHRQPTPTPAGPTPPDPWTQLSSLSDHLATLLPPHPASFFQSHFHSPAHPSPAAALRVALASIVGSKSHPGPSSITTLFTLLDVLRDSPAYASLDAEQRSVLYADAQLVLRATHDRPDDAIDIVWLLLDLDLDHESGTLAMGIYHLPQSPSPLSSAHLSPSTTLPQPPPPPGPTRNRSASTSATRQLPGGPPSILPPPTSKRKSISIAPPAQSQVLEWQTVPSKQSRGPHPLALHIPAYDSANQLRRSAGVGNVKGAGNGLGKGGKGDVGELPKRSDLGRRMAATWRERDELLREASKAWRSGNAKTRGGEVALYFAERARECQESARREALNEARLMVESKRATAADRNTVDLHGTSISEATVIVREILDREGCSAASPLKIITGRGTHSSNGIGVLKPAVRNVLVQDGWNVGVWDGGLVVRGRTPL